MLSMQSQIDFEYAKAQGKTVLNRLVETQGVMNTFGIRFPKPEEFDQLHQTFQPMIKAPIAANDSVRTVHARTGQCVYLLEDRSRALIGSMLLIQLTEAGLMRLATGQPFGHDIHPDWVCQQNQLPEALLVWGLLGKNRMASGRVLAFSLALARKVYHDIPILTYAATLDGARIMSRIGFCPTHTVGLYKLDLSFRKGACYDR